jgi:hypothetical protein
MCSFNECTFMANGSSLAIPTTPVIKIDLVSNIGQMSLGKKNRGSNPRVPSPRNYSPCSHSPPNYSPPNYSPRTHFPEDILRFGNLKLCDDKSEHSTR